MERLQQKAAFCSLVRNHVRDDNAVGVFLANFMMSVRA